MLVRLSLLILELWLASGLHLRKQSKAIDWRIGYWRQYSDSWWCQHGNLHLWLWGNKLSPKLSVYTAEEMVLLWAKVELLRIPRPGTSGYNTVFRLMPPITNNGTKDTVEVNGLQQALIGDFWNPKRQHWKYSCPKTAKSFLIQLKLDRPSREQPWYHCKQRRWQQSP